MGDDRGMAPRLRLLVLRCRDVDASARIFEALGLTFVVEQHEVGPRHLAATLDDGSVVELYPKRGMVVCDERIGFEVPDVLAAVHGAAGAGAKVVAEPTADYALIEDLDGRRVEVLRSAS
jgi:catechol 2,3-dioxygenase-like lactoylglutathione lyase family enzyme